MPTATVLRVARVLVALLGLSSVVLEVITLVGRGVFVPSNFLSFFTIQSNLLAAVTLLLVVARPPSPWLSWLRGLATMCMVVTGLVFAVLAALPARVRRVLAAARPARRLVPVPVPRPRGRRVRRGGHHVRRHRRSRSGARAAAHLVGRAPYPRRPRDLTYRLAVTSG